MSVGQSTQFYPVERLVSCRRRKRTFEYLVKWSGYSSYDNSWEREENITADLVRNFNEPYINQDRLQQNVDKLALAIMSKLKSRNRLQTVIDFDHDCWRFLFNGKGMPGQNKRFRFYERQDFERCNFCANWDKYLDQHGDGMKIKFPVKMKIHLSQSPKVFISKDNEIVQGKRMYLERLAFDFIREPVTCN